MHRLVAVIAIAMFLAACGKSPSPTAAPAAPPASAQETTAPLAAAPGAGADPPAAPAADTGNEARVDQTIDTVLGDHAAYRAAVDALQKAVAANDAEAVSKLIDYPFTASIDGERTKIADADAFVAQYDRIVTPAIARAIGGQRYGDLFVNAKGVMFGRGEAWINGVCKDDACKHVDVRVVTIQPTGP
jgi:hypothetical protein